MMENMENKKKQDDFSQVLTIPNIISFVRILLIIPFIAFFIDKNYIAASITIILSGLSDCFDGVIARKCNQVTELGKMLDPLADKLTLVTVAVCICIMFPVVLPLMIVLAAKDIMMLIGCTYLIRRNLIPPAAKWYGKFGTVVFYFSVSLIVFLKAVFQYESDFLTLVLMTITAITMLFALAKYFGIFLKMKNGDSYVVKNKDIKNKDKNV